MKTTSKFGTNMKRIILFFAATAMCISFSACGGSGNGNGSKDSGGYKGDFAFLEATKESGTALYDNNTQGIITKESLFKKEETPAQKEILDQMMASPNKKPAKVAVKTSFNNGRMALSFYNVSISNGADIKDKDGDFGFDVSLEEFPEAGYPFEKYYIILDKNGNVARIVADRSSYSYAVERTEAKVRILNNESWGRRGDPSYVPDYVKEARRKFWSEGGTPETDRYIIHRD